ncbi:insulinase family protein, partial [Myxococcota bacterium]|nr:insulinase family protein [Myxococcota bacterium]
MGRMGEGRVQARGPILILVSLCIALTGACTQLGFSDRRPWDSAPPALKLGPVVDQARLTRSTLPNGLRVLILEDHRLPRVNLSLVVARGAGAEDPDRAGQATFLAELMNRGAGKRNALALAEAVDALGGTLSVRAGWDSMAVTVDGLSRDQDQLLDILSDVSLLPQLKPEEAEKARNELLASLTADKDDPGSLAKTQAMKVLYPEHRYGLPVKGISETVAKLDSASARDMHTRYFVPGNVILGISGDVNPSDILKKVQERFGKWKEGPLPAEAPPTPAHAPGERKIVIADRPELVQTRILILHEGIDRADPRRVAAGLLNDTLGGSGFSSRLMKKLRSEEGLTYGVSSGFAMRRRAGPFVVSTFTRVDETRRAVDLLLAQIEGIRGDDPQTPEELAKAKSYSVGQFGLGLETSAAVLSALVDL